MLLGLLGGRRDFNYCVASHVADEQTCSYLFLKNVIRCRQVNARSIILGENHLYFPQVFVLNI